MRILNSQSMGASGIGIGGQVLQKFQKAHRKEERVKVQYQRRQQCAACLKFVPHFHLD